MKTKTTAIGLVMALGFGLSLPAQADSEFFGIVESMPSGLTGTWIIDGREVRATRGTDIEYHYGPIKVGSCVKVEMDWNKAEEIESLPPEWCGATTSVGRTAGGYRELDRDFRDYRDDWDD